MPRRKVSFVYKLAKKAEKPGPPPELPKTEKVGLPNTAIHVIGMKKDPSGKELSEIVKNALYELRMRAYPLEPPRPSGRKVLDFLGNSDLYLKGVRPTTLESGRRMVDFMGNVIEYLQGVRPSPWKINEYIVR